MGAEQSQTLTVIVVCALLLLALVVIADWLATTPVDDDETL